MSKLLNKKGFYYPQINFKPFYLQYQALEYLWDDTTKEILFGGSMASGKSFLSASFSTLECLKYPGIHVGIFRTRLTDIKRTFLPTIYEFFKLVGLEEDIHFTIDRQMMIIEFYNDSKIFFGELYYNPASDPEYERIKGMNLTHAILDEASMMTEEAFQIVSTRIRYKLEEYGITGKMLIVTNPCSNFIYGRYYKPYINNTLPDYIKVVLGKPTDNETITQEYVDDQKNRLSPIQYRRQILGDWEVEESELSVFHYEDLVNCFYNHVNNLDTYMSVDVADIGSDSTIITIWKGFEIVDIIKLNERTDVVEEKIKELIIKWKIRVQNIVVDATGVGIGVANHIKGCYHFKGASKALLGEAFRNVKDQVIMKAAKYVEQNEIKFLDKYKNEILKEFQNVQFDNIDKERIEIETKAKQKKRLGYSSDYFDSIVMRFIFTIKKKNVITIGN